MKKSLLASTCIFLLFSFEAGRLLAQPIYDIHPKRLDFGSVKVGSSRNLPVIVRCGDTGLMIYNAVSMNPNFTVSSDAGPLDPNDSVRFTITFKPDSAGPKSGVIVFVLNTTAHWDTVLVSGTGGSPSVTDDLQPASFALFQNYPNPFNPATNISFSTATPGRVTLVVRDLFGAEVATLVNGSLDPGGHRIGFDATGLPSGQYVYTLYAEGKRLTRMMTVLK